MDTKQLVRMANQIGAFFETMPDQDKAMAGVAEHLRKFWEPRMRRELLAFLEKHPDGRTDGIALSAFVLRAIMGHRVELTPAS